MNIIMRQYLLQQIITNKSVYPEKFTDNPVQEILYNGTALYGTYQDRTTVTRQLECLPTHIPRHVNH